VCFPDYADNINASTVVAKQVTNSTGNIKLEWEPPQNPNGLIIKYLIRYRRASSDVSCVSLFHRQL
jgi:hypothetical protein